jgi:hypothetical protein
MYDTEQGGSSCNAYELHAYRIADIETESFVGFTQFRQADGETLPQIRSPCFTH